MTDAQTQTTNVGYTLIVHNFFNFFEILNIGTTIQKIYEFLFYL